MNVTCGAAGAWHVSICALEFYPALELGDGCTGGALVQGWQYCLTESESNVARDVVTFWGKLFAVSVRDEFDGVFQPIGSPWGVGHNKLGVWDGLVEQKITGETEGGCYIRLFAWRELS